MKYIDIKTNEKTLRLISRILNAGCSHGILPCGDGCDALMIRCQVHTTNIFGKNDYCSLEFGPAYERLSGKGRVKGLEKRLDWR